jgi:adenosylcobalamin-dependent ribonucleoside-triphosphate reductase
VVTACDTQLGVGFSGEEEERLTNYMLALKGTVAGRFLWQMGTDTVNELGLLSLQNCALTVVDEPIRPFTWAMDALMLGSGVGFNIQRENVYKLPKVRDDFVAPVRQDTADADFVVPDTRQGWVKLLEYTLRAAFEKDTNKGMVYSTQLIRGKGTPIKRFGGVASGPEDLVIGISSISGILTGRKGKQLRPIDCLDIMNIIGQIVVSGNVRRSAQIAIGDPDDFQFLRAKNWSSGNIPNWRSNSNNSVVCNSIEHLPNEFWKTYEGKSEPYGLINLKLSRNTGRLGDTQYKDKQCMGYNPCAEQSLWDKETCCLSEVFLPNIESPEELLDLVTLLYRVNKHSLRLPCHLKETEAIVHKNMRMGIGVTGYLQATEEQRKWLPYVYEQLRVFDKQYSAAHGWPVSIKLTTCKPSGTLSLLPGVTAGIHAAYAQYMIRRIRISSNHPLVDVCREHGYNVEYQKNFDGTDDRNTVLVEFPFAYPEGTVLASELTAVDQLEWVKRLQTEWSDNSISCTVYYRKEELPEIKKYLQENYDTSFKSLSFLLHSEHGFLQAPIEEISKEQYEALVKKVKPITNISFDNTMLDGSDCEGGACPVR